MSPDDKGQRRESAWKTSETRQEGSPSGGGAAPEGVADVPNPAPARASEEPALSTPNAREAEAENLRDADLDRMTARECFEYLSRGLEGGEAAILKAVAMTRAHERRKRSTPRTGEADR